MKKTVKTIKSADKKAEADDTQVQPVGSKSRHLPWKKVSVGVAAIIIFSGVGVVTYWEVAQQNATKAMTAPEVTSLVQQVGKLIVLPEGESPTVATVSDVSKLAGQPFFAHAQNGDRVLIYPKANKAYLYNPSQNRIVEVGPITTSQTVAGAKTASPSAQQKNKTITVAIYNGTNVQGLAASTGKKIESSFPDVAIVKMGNASQYYPKTIIVDLKNNPSVAASIAQALGGEVGALPDTEATTSADILVITGQ